jgi:hypothetical protein
LHSGGLPVPSEEKFFKVIKISFISLKAKNFPFSEVRQEGIFWNRGVLRERP